jgi:hypothetical protein
MSKKALRPRRPSAQQLRDEERRDALKELLESLGFVVTLSRTLESRGGHCLVRGQQRLILARWLPASEQVDVMVEVLSGLDLEGVFVRPDLRELVQPPDRSSGSRPAAGAAGRGPGRGRARRRPDEAARP